MNAFLLQALRSRLAMLLMFALTWAAVPVQGQSIDPAPKSYDIARTATPPRIDGHIDDPAWRKAAWTTDFIDIQGDLRPKPRFRTHVKMLWDAEYLYIAAELEEPNISATLTAHDSVIFHDNDFELFVKPLVASESYYEFEINALNTGWDLFLNKPYRFGGKADNSWDVPGLKTAVALQGTLNQPADHDTGWTVEIAFPWSAFRQRQPEVEAPHAGSEWRVNFSRVEWKAGQAKEDNWVWSPQGVINMHVPERWGYLRFVDTTISRGPDVSTARPSSAAKRSSAAGAGGPSAPVP